MPVSSSSVMNVTSLAVPGALADQHEAGDGDDFALGRPRGSRRSAHGTAPRSLEPLAREGDRMGLEREAGRVVVEHDLAQRG